MKKRELTRELRVPRDIEEVFPFFADPFNLGLLTPPRFRLQILTPRPISMWEGTLIDYRLYVAGIPLRWTSDITVWEPPHRFVDEQVRGPYRYWRHAHTFEKLLLIKADLVLQQRPQGHAHQRQLVELVLDLPRTAGDTIGTSG